MAPTYVQRPYAAPLWPSLPELAPASSVNHHSFLHPHSNRTLSSLQVRHSSRLTRLTWRWSGRRCVLSVLIRINLIGSLGRVRRHIIWFMVCYYLISLSIVSLFVILGLTRRWRSVRSHVIRLSLRVWVIRGCCSVISNLLCILRVLLCECHSLSSRYEPAVICQWRLAFPHASSGVQVSCNEENEESDQNGGNDGPFNCISSLYTVWLVASQAQEQQNTYRAVPPVSIIEIAVVVGGDLPSESP